MGIPPLLFILTNQQPTVAAHNSWRTSIMNLSINLTNGANSLPQSSWSPSPTPVAIQSVSESTEKTRGPQHAREIPFNLQRVYLDWVTFLPCVHGMWRWRTNQKAFVPEWHLVCRLSKPPFFERGHGFLESWKLRNITGFIPSPFKHHPYGHPKWINSVPN